MPTGRFASRGPEYRLRTAEADVTSRDLGFLCELLALEAESLLIRTASPHVFIHAAVAGWNDRAILVPGRSMTGKSTLVHALVRAGATYYSDEYAVLDAEGLVLPYPRPIELRVGGKRRIVKVEPAGTEPLRIGAIFKTSFRDGASFRPRRQPAGRGALALIDNAIAARTRPAAVLAATSKAAANAAVYSGRRGNADDAAAIILKRV